MKARFVRELVSQVFFIHEPTEVRGWLDKETVDGRQITVKSNETKPYFIYEVQFLLIYN